MELDFKEVIDNYENLKPQEKVFEIIIYLYFWCETKIWRVLEQGKKKLKKETFSKNRTELIFFPVFRFVDYFFITLSIVQVLLETDDTLNQGSIILLLFIIGKLFFIKLLDIICFLYFLIEFMLRFITCHNSIVLWTNDPITIRIKNLRIYNYLNEKINKLNKRNYLYRFLRFQFNTIIS
jgi:hypothetical protein